MVNTKVARRTNCRESSAIFRLQSMIIWRGSPASVSMLYRAETILMAATNETSKRVIHKTISTLIIKA